MIHTPRRAHLCSHTEEASETVAEALRDTVSIVDVVEEAVPRLPHSSEEVCIMLSTIAKGEH